MTKIVKKVILGILVGAAAGGAFFYWKYLQSSSFPCKISGCNGEICSDQNLVSACVFRPQNICFKTARCERQSDGSCDWTPTEELTRCIQEKKSG